MAEIHLRSHSTSELAESPDTIPKERSKRSYLLDPKLLQLRLSEDIHVRNCSSPGTPTPIPTPERSANASPVTPDTISIPEDIFSEGIISKCIQPDNIQPKRVRTNLTENQDPPDERIQNELERMNRSCDDINNLESQLTRNRNEERRILREGNKRLKDIKLQISEKTVDTARYYYETLQTKKELQMRLNGSAIEFEKAKYKRDDSRAGVVESESEYMKLRQSLKLQQPDNNGIDHNSSHQYSEAIESVNTANQYLDIANHELYDKQRSHKEQLLEFNAFHLRLEEYRRKNHKSVLKALPYFQAKSQYEEKQQDLLATRHFIQDQIKEAKIRYSVALKNLEAISLQIHHMRDPNTACSFKIELMREPSYLLDGDSSEASYQRENAQSMQSLRSLQSFKDIREIDHIQPDISPDKSNSMQCLQEFNKEHDISLKLL
ncbi:SH3 domain-binding protein 5-like protein isoform X2 [Oopsacas minuta]|uniref:SH3 domain-binding protein 5-like protein isoform X2 n=1 Tax=Oopsacas minuta TaxID=111878 RepID=A0AAV7KKI9_9METZ|nr:SH3 domain-binding protein 5-like protein isoform X2 [Oopsacas minuta]